MQEIKENLSWHHNSIFPLLIQCFIHKHDQTRNPFLQFILHSIGEFSLGYYSVMFVCNVFRTFENQRRFYRGCILLLRLMESRLSTRQLNKQC